MPVAHEENFPIVGKTPSPRQTFSGLFVAAVTRSFAACGLH